jgi:hypothetical protein
MSKLKLSNDILVANIRLLPCGLVVTLSVFIGEVLGSNLGGKIKYTQISSVWWVYSFSAGDKLSYGL